MTLSSAFAPVALRPEARKTVIKKDLSEKQRKRFYEIITSKKFLHFTINGQVNAKR